jgi:amidohydrolase
LIVTALQTVVSRDTDPLEPAVVTVGTIHGGDARNIIPDRVELSGTLRAYTSHVMETVISRVRDIMVGVAAVSGATADLRIVSETPPVVNDREVAEVVQSAATAVVGPTGVLCERVAFSEDAAFFLDKVPGCYFLVGSANPERGLDVPLHNPRFDFDEDALPLATAVMVEVAAHYL